LRGEYFKKIEDKFDKFDEMDDSKEEKDEYFQSLLDDMDDLLKDMRQREKDSDHLVSEHMKTVNDIFDNAIKNFKKDRS
jgi:Na+/phosphate symporter